jgi:hyperosmotically inducible protein
MEDDKLNMRTQLMSGAVLLTTILIAGPVGAGAGETIDKAENKVKDAMHEAKDAVSDSWLTSKTKIALFADDRVKGRDVRVETTAGEVYLHGKVDSGEAKTAAEDIAKSIEGVKDVRNDLQVVARTARKTVEANDKQITKAVETTFGRDAQLKKIDVRTDAGVVILSGEVRDIAVSAKASEMAHRVDGVRSVKNEIRVAPAKSS